MDDESPNDAQFLTPSDKELLNTELKITSTAEFGTLDRPEGLPAKFRRIVVRYDETPKGGKKAGHNPHLDCAFQCHAKHWRGFIVELEGEQLVRVGKDCGHKHLGADFQRGMNAYSALETRKFELRRLLALRSEFPAAVSALKSAVASANVAAFDRYLAVLRREFAPMSRELADSVRRSSGRLMAAKRVRDGEREEASARMVDAREARANGTMSRWKSITEAPTPAIRERAVRAWKNFVSSQPPAYKIEYVDVGSCDGWKLLDPKQAPPPSSLLSAALLKADEVASQLLRRRSDEWQSARIVQLKKDVREVLDAWAKALASMRVIDQFTGEANIAAIASWAQQTEKDAAGIGQNVIASGRAIADLDSASKLELPVGFEVPTARAMERIDEILNRKFELWDSGP